MKIASVIVTFNRLTELKIAIKRYEEQNFLPAYVIVVDNSSSDGTKEFLDEWEKIVAPFKKVVIHLPQNLGGSGGFYEGLKYALNTTCDWYWIADDDAFLDADTFEKMALFEREYAEVVRKCSAICCSVVRNPKSMEIDVGHRRRIAKKCGMPKQYIIPAEEYNKKFFEIGLFTFVGSMIKAEVVKKIGLPRGDFFIYYDDLEYSYRVSKTGSIYCLPESKIFHDTAKHEEEYGSNWRSYYQSRNMMLFYKSHFPFAYYKMITKRVVQRICLKCFRVYTVSNQLDWDAMCDAIKNRSGLSEKYYIGWKANL